MTHKGTVALETERLNLRRFTPADAEAMFKNWAGDAEVTRYLTWPAHTDASVSLSVIEDWMPLYESESYYNWAIVLKEMGEPVGNISAVRRRDDIGMVHIGYCLGRGFWRRGYMSEALAEVVRFFFEDVGAARVESRHDPRNPHSGAVMRKCGLRYEGTARQADRNNQGVGDAVHYAILASDYFGRNKKGNLRIGDAVK